MKNGKIGIFDSGLGGLVIARAIVNKLPNYDYIYFGDTKNLPYGSKKQEQIYGLTKKAVDFLFAQNCELIIVACNTVSAKALRKIQQQYLPKKYPGKKVLGVLVPTVEVVCENKKLKHVGVLATSSTVNSKAYVREFKKLNKKLQIQQVAAPELVPLIEQQKFNAVSKPLAKYVSKFQNIDALILGCTHYPLIKKQAENLVGENVTIFSQDEIIPKKLHDYLQRHNEIKNNLSTKGQIQITASKTTTSLQHLAKKWFGKSVSLKEVKL